MPSNICRICKRVLKNPLSVKLGIGPVCRAKDSLQKEFDFMKANAIEGFGDIICSPDGTTNVPHRIVYHSPTGLSWGYGGSGPADMALNALAVYVGEDEAKKYYQDFKWAFISKMPKEGGTIKREDVLHWLEEKEKESEAAYA